MATKQHQKQLQKQHQTQRNHTLTRGARRRLQCADWSQRPTNQKICESKGRQRLKEQKRTRPVTHCPTTAVATSTASAVATPPTTTVPPVQMTAPPQNGYDIEFFRSYPITRHCQKHNAALKYWRQCSENNRPMIFDKDLSVVFDNYEPAMMPKIIKSKGHN